MLHAIDTEAADLTARVAARVAGPLVPEPLAPGLDETAVIVVYDDILPDPDAYRQLAVTQPFASVSVGPVTFHGIAPAPDNALIAWLVRQHPALVPTLTFLRQSPAGQIEPNYIHTDCDMGEWTGILYLNPAPDPSDGTIFWRSRLTGSGLTTARTDGQRLTEALAWRDPAQWDCARFVPARFNRLLLFDARAFHSRAVFDNYGHGATARLIQIVFGKGTLCP